MHRGLGPISSNFLKSSLGFFNPDLVLAVLHAFTLSSLFEHVGAQIWVKEMPPVQVAHVPISACLNA